MSVASAILIVGHYPHRAADPEEEFAAWASRFVVQGECRPENVVSLKRECPATVSYTYLVKRLERLQFAAKGTLGGVNYVKLEEQLFGPPLYKRILSWRSRRSMASARAE